MSRPVGCGHVLHIEAANLHAVFKAYDVRGRVPDQIDEDLARAVGAAFVAVTGAPAARESSSGTTCAPPRPAWPRAFAEGAAAAGADVTLIGLASTDQLYFASGSLGLPGAMFTASHNPAQYNGIKMCRARAVPRRHGDRARRDPRPASPRATLPRAATGPAASPSSDVLDDYAAHLLTLAPDHRPPAHGRRRRRQRDGRPHRARRARTASTSTSCRCTSSSTAPSRTTRPTRSSRQPGATCRPRCARPAPTSASRSTATPTAASSSTSAARSSTRRSSPR